jgi:predicted transglutaminase-like cysteine proteinase
MDFFSKSTRNRAFKIVLSCLLLTKVAGCATALVPATTTTALAPATPGWLAFCKAHDPLHVACDPIPPATAMRDSKSAMAPIAWHDYCRRHREDSACTG